MPETPAVDTVDTVLTDATTPWTPLEHSPVLIAGLVGNLWGAKVLPKLSGVLINPDKPAQLSFNGKQFLRLGRWLRKEFPDWTEQDCDTVISQLTAILWSASIYDFARQSSVSDVYNASNEIAGMSSCMTGGESKYMEWLDENDCAEVVVCSDKKTGKWKARAILWHTNEGPTVMDRVYPNSGIHCTALLNWAHNQGYAVRNHQGAPSQRSTFLNANGARVCPVSVTLENPTNGLYPYLDTFNTGDKKGTGWTLRSDETGYIEFLSCDGLNSESPETTTCSGCGDHFDDNEIYHCPDGEPYCECCYNDTFSTCEGCDETIYQNDLTCSPGDTYLCSGCLNEQYPRCDGCRTRTAEADCRLPEAGYDVLCESCYGDKYTTCEGCDAEVEIDDCPEDSKCSDCCDLDTGDDKNDKT